jgi:predicted O-methyltransferase YrrM
MHVDPFAIKRLPKSHPKRLLFTLWSRGQELCSKLFFNEYMLPIITLDNLPPLPDVKWQETQVEPEQARYLIKLLRETETLNGVAVEVGSWRGETTLYLATNTSRNFIAIDPWIGPKNEENLRAFETKVADMPNVKIERKTFGQAWRNWCHGPVSFAFIDGAHDYCNVAHDLAAIVSLLIPGGIVVFHDTDNIDFPGARRAIFEEVENFQIIAHIPNLTALCRR